MISELKAFLLRGNVVDLAVAVVIGAAFSAIVTELVDQIINPFIGLVLGQPDLSGLALTIGEGDDAPTFGFGSLLNAIIDFLLVGTVLFFVVRAANALVDRRRDETTDEVTVQETPEEIVLLREIRDRLGAASSEVPPPPGPSPT